jgi:predicted MFS family arabinose efflux permease
VLLSGVGIGGYHLAMLAGRLLMARVLPRWGERRVVAGAGLLACVGITVAVLGGSVAAATGGLLLVGFAIAPVVPSALSLAGRSAPGRAAPAARSRPPPVTARSSRARSWSVRSPTPTRAGP